MDPYEKKFAEMQKYIPFLEAMIERLKKVKDKSREPQLQKMLSLHGILSKSNDKKLTIEKLDRCENVLLKLHSRVDKGNASSSNVQSNKIIEETKPIVTGTALPETATKVSTKKDPESYRENMSKRDETPASPSPPASPDQNCDNKIVVKPIIIPTERNDGYTGTTIDDRPASPDECELVASVGLRQPVIIPTEPIDVKPKYNLTRKIVNDDSDNRIARWTFPSKHSGVRQKKNLWKPNEKTGGTISTVSRVTAAKPTPDSRPRILRHIPTEPTPTKSSCLLRKPVLVLEKKNSQSSGSEMDISPTSKWDSIKSTVTDGDSIVDRGNVQTSPKTKEQLPPLPKLPTTPLLVSPPPVLTMPPLTNEDLAELLSGDGDGATARGKSDGAKDATRKMGSERSMDDARQLDNRDVESRMGNSSNKESSKSSSQTFGHDDVDSDRRWEEEYKQIVKMPSRRTGPSSSSVPSKHSELKFPPNPPSVVQSERPTDPRKRPPSPVIAKERDSSVLEPRYSDNYEKHQRQSRDSHGHNPNSEHNPSNSAFPRCSDNDSNNSMQNDDRNNALYQRRNYAQPSMHDHGSADPRREKSEYYNRMMHQQERDMQQNVNNRPGLHHSPGRSSEVCNQSQWGPNSNYPPVGQGPNVPYPQQRPDMWTMIGGPGNSPMEPHMMGDPSYMRQQGQYPGPSNNCRGPMMSPQDMNHGPCMDQGFRDDMPNQQSMIPPLLPQMGPQSHGPGMPQQHSPAIPPLMQPQGYQMAGQYRGFPPENRPPVQQFDRPQDFPQPRQSWEQPVIRPPDNIPYSRQGPPGQWNRPNRGPPASGGPGPSGPLPGSAATANRDRPYNDRGRGSDGSRPGGFNRDPRTRADPPGQQQQQQHGPTGQTGSRRDHILPPPPPPPPPLLPPPQLQPPPPLLPLLAIPPLPPPSSQSGPPTQNVNSPTTPSNPRRDPRYAKETAQAPTSKPKDHGQSNDRNSRRLSDTKNKPNPSKDSRKSNDKNRSQNNKNDRKARRESDSDNKIVEKSSKDVMQSPLESLYGVIDTAAKTGKGYGLQKFKIPKIKRPEPVPSPPRIVDDAVEENWDDIPDVNSGQFDTVGAKDDAIDITVEDAPATSNRKDSDDKKSEVTSTTGETVDDTRQSRDNASQSNDDSTSKDTTTAQSTIIESPVVEILTKIAEANAAKSKDTDSATNDQAPGDWQNLLEAKFLAKITELLHSKKMKEQFKKFIGTDSSDSSDKDNESSEMKKVASRKKRRLISSSDSSEEECLAERLGIIDALNKDDTETTESRVNPIANDKTIDDDDDKVDNDDGPIEDSTAVSVAMELSSDTSHDNRSGSVNKAKPFRRKKRESKKKSETPVAPEPGRSNDEAQSVEDTTNQPKTDDPKTDDNPPAPKPQPAAKAKIKRRNSLEMLQEDVREMFISDEVVTATGFRSCRLQKEDAAQLNSSLENLGLSNSRRKGSTSSLDRTASKIASDADDREQRPSTARGRGGRTRIRRRTRGRAKQPQSVKQIVSSESDDEDSSRLDTSRQNDSTNVVKESDDSLRSDVATEISKDKDESEDTQFLRRSERVGLRGSVKEARICLKKTESGKMDSSKIIFDSSSDESFGIDVSELTAAVDISLHPERHNSSSSTIDDKTAVKNAIKKTTPRSGKSRGNATKTIEHKVEILGSADEVDSIASDLSRESSLTRVKKMNATPGNKPDTNEELLSDILGGLVDPNTSNQPDNDVEDSTTMNLDAKINTRKKKKKKACWQLGIVRKKKKKIQSPVPTSVTDVNEESTNANAEFESSFEIPESKIDPTDVGRLDEIVNSEIEPKEETLSDSSAARATENSMVDGESKPSIVGKEEPMSPTKIVSQTEIQIASVNEPVDDEKSSIELVDDKSEVEINAEGCLNIGVRRLMSYTWSARKERFKCMFCPWIGKNIVHHYTLGHPGKEVMISRLTIPESKRAIGQAMIENYEARTSGTMVKDCRKFSCRFCAYTTEGSAGTALEAFYEHCTTHTGEYRFRCNSCPYQTVARSSMRTHYYRRACANKYQGNLGLAISEDPVPIDDFLYGYLCTKCNFVQLKETNVRKHVKSTHHQIPQVDVLKIDMSSHVDNDLHDDFTSIGDSVDRKDDLKTEIDASRDVQSVTSSPKITGTIVDPDKIDIVDEPPRSTRQSKKLLDKHAESSTIVSSRNDEIDTPIVTGNLNAFVCPPELENKEDEIQHERRKKMQEVVDDIGIMNKTGEKRDLSIIDKLKNKMTTNIDESVAEAEAREIVEDAAEIVAREKNTLPILLVDSVTSLAIGKNNTIDDRGSRDDNRVEGNIVDTEISVKIEPGDSTDRLTSSAIADAETDAEDETEKKPKDPLTSVDDLRKDESTDEGDESDREDPIERSRSYESDTSENSDGEVPADVNSLLEESFNMNTPVNAPMMTTIQRLAAKLQGEKSLPISGNDVAEITPISIEDTSTERNIPKPPNAIPIADIQRLFDKRNFESREIVKTVETTEKIVPPIETISPPKKFIRLRRLSGDKLSVPVVAADSPEKNPISVASTSTMDNTSTRISETNLDPVDNDENNENDDDECSFLKIESVVSLAPGNDCHPNETMINDIRMAVASSPKVSNNLSLLKKSSPNILKRSMTTTTIRQGPIQIVPMTSVLPISGQVTKQNVKLVKVIKGRTLIKQKDSTHKIYGSDYKNTETFYDMLNPEKLRHLYKCMARTCSYTTDSLQSFGNHYRKHKESIDRSQAAMITSYDFQRCAYCNETLTTWNSMSDHLRDKHIYCQYQCGYCFYRALAQSYVELHQSNVHRDSKIFVLLGVQENPPIEVIDRRDYVIPFVCHHECGKSFYVPGAFLAHLRTKHGNSLSIFKCHMCPAPLFKAEQLVGHYKLHGIYKYQCLYCLFGSEQSSDVHGHLSASHYNRPPHILERTLQPRPVRDKDVIQQLVVLNVDEGYKCKELTLIEGQTSNDIPQTKHWLQVDRNTSDGSAVGVVTLPVGGNISMNRLLPYEKLDSVDTTKNFEPKICNPATPVITKFRKCSPIKSPDNSITIDDTTVNDRENDSYELTKIGMESTSKIDDARSSIVRNDDEFVDFNVLGSFRFLGIPSKSDVEKQCDRRESTMNDDVDSDIEILEDVVASPKKFGGGVTTKISIAPLIVGDVKNLAKKEKCEKTVMTTTNVEPVIVSSSESSSSGSSSDGSSPENSSDVIVNLNPVAVDVEETIDKPRTLDDIKSTGFTGRHLYRCGYDSCEFGSETAGLLRNHIKECIFASETKNLNCVHCGKRFVKIGFLLEHFKLHGLKRFGCSLCNDRWTQPYQAMSHMKMKHRQTYSKIIPADPKNPAADGLFIVEPIAATGERSRGKKRGRAKSAEIEKMLDVQKIAYGPTEIDSLPRQPIYQQEVHCAVCPYRSKVRTNIMRHLQLHAKDETVPETGPINPVPCLDKNEKMFDKMVNLASSSHQNGRMGGTKPKEKIDNDAEFLPKFVPENKRYVCGVTECNYLSIDEGMLRTHVKALHPEEPYFRCPHCPAQVPGHEAQNIAIDKMGIHLKMHDTRLYKCSHCNNHHYHRHVVERHLSDKHPEANPFVKVIREIETTDNTDKQTLPENDENSADPDGNNWKCNVCDYKCMYKAEMVGHAASNHDAKSQFKCTLCSYRSNNKLTFDQHVNAKHPTDATADFMMIYEKIKGSATKRPTDAVADAIGLDEPFDTTPLWRRDMPRIRHIRGILFEDEDAARSETPAKSAKRKSDAEATTKIGKTKIVRSSIDNATMERGDGDSFNGNVMSETSNNADDCYGETENNDKNSGRVDTSRLVRKFGPYGSPVTHFWRCTICQSFKTKYKQDIRDHLYRDLKYLRFRCGVCGYAGVGRNVILKHFMRTHENRQPTYEELTALPIDEDLETWVQTLIKSQMAQMRGMLVDEDGNIIGPAQKKKTNVASAGRRSTMENIPKPTIASITQGSSNEAGNSSRTVDLNQVISEMKNKTATGDADVGAPEIDDEDSDGNDTLVIDSKDDGLEHEAPDNTAMIDDCEPTIEEDPFIVCKHCNMQFERSRGFKLHVQIRHLRRLNFLCPYCDTSSNSEKLMRKHLRLKHQNLPELIQQNPSKNLPELTSEFWEREYGLVGPEKSSRKRRRTTEEISQDQFDKNPRDFHICTTCGFRAINTFGLGVHMRIHSVAKSYKCSYCTFATSEKSELWQHSEKNHSNLDWKIGNGDDALMDVVEPETVESSSSTIDNYANYVAAETTSTKKSTNDKKFDVAYMCFYCNQIRANIDELKIHWGFAHKNIGKTSTLPFRYKEITDNTEKKLMRCGYCPKRGLAATIRLHSRKKHASKPVKLIEVATISDNWICQWCNEKVYSESKMKIHQKMFHSHLPPNFKPSSKVGNVGNVGNSTVEDTSSYCPKCPFKTTSLIAMQKHVAKHVDSVRCKRCEKTFPDVTIAILHNTQAHPGEVSAIEGFTTNVDKMMSRVNWRNNEGVEKNVVDGIERTTTTTSTSTTVKRHGGVAKKSTTKSIIVKPTPSDIRSVARKSTNPLPRYPPGTRFSIDDCFTNDAATTSTSVKIISHYGLPLVPVNLNNISTYMTLSGGRRMKLNCTTLAQLFDIEPKVLVEDIKGDLKKFRKTTIDDS